MTAIDQFLNQLDSSQRPGIAVMPEPETGESAVNRYLSEVSQASTLHKPVQESGSAIDRYLQETQAQQPTPSLASQRFKEEARKKVGGLAAPAPMQQPQQEIAPPEPEPVQPYMPDKRDESSFFENMAGKWKSGSRKWAIDQAGYDVATSPGYIGLQKSLQEFRKFNREQAYQPQGRFWLERAAFGAAESAPGMAKAYAKGIPGAIAGAGTALAVGSLLPIPEEAVTVPMGIKWGLTAGSAHQWYKQGTGEMFLTMVDDGVSPDIAKQTARVAGVMYAAAEYVFNLIPGLPAMFRNNPVISSSIRRTAMSLAKEYGKGVVLESSEEFLQQAIQEFAGNIAKDIQASKGGKVLAKVPIADVMQRAASAFVQSIGPSAILIAPGQVAVSHNAVQRSKAIKAAGIPENYQLVEGRDGYEMINPEGKVAAAGKNIRDVIKKAGARLSGGVPVAPIADTISEPDSETSTMTGRAYDPVEMAQAQSKIEELKSEMRKSERLTDEEKAIIDDIELSERWDREVEFSELLAGMTGKNIIITRNSPVNGATIAAGDTIFVDDRSQQPMLAAIGHELNHAFDGQEFESADNIMEAADQIMRNAVDPAMLEARATENNTTVDKVWAEARGDIIGQAMTTKEFWQRVGDQSPSLLQKMYAKISRIIGKFRKLFDNKYKGTGISHEVSGMFQSKDQMDAAFTAASDVFYQWTQSAQAKKQGFGIGQTKALARIAKQNMSGEEGLDIGLAFPTTAETAQAAPERLALPQRRLFGMQPPEAGNREQAFANIARAVNETTDRKELIGMAKAVEIKIPTSTKALKNKLITAWQQRWEQEVVAEPEAEEFAPPPTTPPQEPTEAARPITPMVAGEGVTITEEQPPPPTTTPPATKVERPVVTPVVREGVDLQEMKFAAGSSVRLGSNPQPFTITEILEPTADEKELGEQFYVIKNNKTGEEITAERQDLKSIKLQPEAKRAVTTPAMLNNRLKELGMDATAFKNKKQKQAAIKRAEAKLEAAQKPVPKPTAFEQTRKYATTKEENANLDAANKMAQQGEVEFSKQARTPRAIRSISEPVRKEWAKYEKIEAKLYKRQTMEEMETASNERIMKAGNTESARQRIAKMAKERDVKELPKEEARKIIYENGLENVFKQIAGGTLQVDEISSFLAQKVFSSKDATDRALSDDINRKAMLTVAMGNNIAFMRKAARIMRFGRDPVKGPEQRRAALNEMLAAPSDALIGEWERLTDAERFERAQVDAKTMNPRIKTMQRLGIDLSTITDEQLMDDNLFSEWLRLIQSHRASKMDKVYEYWRNSILSGPLTQVVNVMGNAAMMNWEFFVQRPAEALFNTVMNKKDAPTLESLVTMYKHILPSMVQANMNLVKAWSTEQPSTRGLRIEEKGVAIGGKGGRFVRSAQRGMLSMDEWFKTIIQTATRADYAVREANKQGLTGNDRDEFIRYSMDNPNSEANQRAINESLRLTWQNEPMELGKIALASRRSKGLTGWIFKFLLPFVTTPSNIISTGMRKSPLGLLNIAFKGLATGEYKKEGGGAMLLRDTTEQILAGAVMWSLYGLTAGDGDDPPKLTGTVSALPAKRRFQYTNLPPQSIRIGERWFSYSRVEPLATVLTTTVDMLNAWRHAKEGNTQGIADDLWQSLKSNVRDKTFLQSIGDVIRAIEDDSRAVGIAQNFASSWMPNIVRQSLRATDPYVRDYRTQQKGWEKTKEILGKTGAMTLPVSGLQPPPRRDYWGKPASKDTDMGMLGIPTSDILWRLMVPFRAQRAITINNIDRMIWNWNRVQTERANIWWPINPRNVYKLYPRENDKRMTPEVYDRFQELRGTHAWQLLKNRHYNFNKPSEREIDAVRKVFSKSTTYAKRLIVNELREAERGKAKEK